MDEKKQIEEMAKVVEDANEFTIEGITNAFIKCKIVGIKLAAKLYNAGYRKQSEWISVDERLPEEVYGKHRKRISVLVCTESGKISTASRQRAVHFDKSKLVWVELDTFDWSGRKHITHWMPLPEPPKEGGAE